MRVIPVIDLKGGVAVHAVRGDRERYRPLRSRIAEGSDPVQLTRAVRERFGLDELYVADLDAIAGGPGNPDVVAALARGGAGDGGRRDRDGRRRSRGCSSWASRAS